MSFDWRIVQKWSRHGWKQVSLDPSHKRVAVSQVEPHQLKPRYAFPDEPKGLLARFVGPGREALRQTILPVGYPQSVHPNFLPFNTWNFVQSISGSANGGIALPACRRWFQSRSL